VRKTCLFIGIALTGALVDIISKTLIFSLLNYDFQTGHSKTLDLIPGIFGLRCVTNTGVIWGLFQGEHSFVFIILWITAVPAIILMFFLLKRPETTGIPGISSLGTIAFGLILAGALGNLYDRLFYSQVRDFLDFYLIHWPVFNLADAFISVGAVLLLITTFRSSPCPSPKRGEAQGEGATVGGKVDEY